MVHCVVDDIDEIVRAVRFDGWQTTHAGEREAWRATSDKARRRQHSYKKRLTNRLVRQDYFEDEFD